MSASIAVGVPRNLLFSPPNSEYLLNKQGEFTPFDSADETHALVEQAFQLRRRNDLAVALALFTQALAQTQAAGPADSRQILLDLALIKREMGVTHGNLGQYSHAQALHEEALAMRKRVLDKFTKHVLFCESMNDIGEAMARQDRMDLHIKAQTILKHALAMREELCGPNHIDVARPLNCLGESYVAAGNYLEAKPVLVRAVAIAEQLLDHDPDSLPRDLTRGLYNLAGVHLRLKHHARAQPVFERVLALRQRFLGPEHADVGAVLSGLGVVLKQQGKLRKAKPVFERCLAIYEKVYGPNHDQTAAAISNLASLYRDQNNLHQALPLFERSLAIDEQVLGPNHLDVALSLHNLAYCCADFNQDSRAKELWDRSLAIYDRHAGPGKTHPQSAVVLQGLAMLAQKCGQAPSDPRCLSIASVPRPIETVGARPLRPVSSVPIVRPNPKGSTRTPEPPVAPDSSSASATAAATAAALAALPAPAPPPTQPCGACVAPLVMTAAQVCSRCKAAWYCNRECQKTAWKAHKAQCAPSEEKK
jgi:tetratricopeptide (TPR) repeat protein